MDKFYVYQDDRPVSIVDNADKMSIDQIGKLWRTLREQGQFMVVKPIKRGDFDFDPVTGQKVIKITKFEYTEFAV